MSIAVKLKNGSEEALPLVSTTMLTLTRLFQERPIHAFELVSLCRDPEHRPFGQTGVDLVGLAMASNRQGGGFSVHDSVRNVVLSAVTGEGFDLSLCNPIAELPNPIVIV